MTKLSLAISIITIGISVAITANASELTIKHSFQSGTPALASEVNENFSDVKTAVDDNNTQIGNLGGELTSAQANITNHEQRITALEDSAGALGYGNVITVATSGGDFTSVAAATASITDASSTNTYLVRVMPGVYTETALVQVPSYVHLQGSGPNATVLTSSRGATTPSTDAATIEIGDNGRVSDLSVFNDGTNTYGIALYSASTTRNTVIDNVVANANGAGGTGHFAAYWNDAEAIIRNSTLLAGGAIPFGTAVNAAFGSVNAAGGFPQALIENSTLIGGANNTLVSCVDSTGTGYGLMLSSSSPHIRHSEICGGHRGVAVLTNGHALIHASTIKASSTSNAFLFEISASGSISVANSGVSYLGNKFTGAGTGLRCVHDYDWGTYTALSDGVTAATACD